MSDEPREKLATTIRVSVSTGVEGDRTDLEMEPTVVQNITGQWQGAVTYRVDGVQVDRVTYLDVIETLKLGQPRLVQL